MLVVVFLAYDSNSLVSDISLLKLAFPVTFTNYIIPACLPVQDVDVTVGMNCTISGWGNTEGKKLNYLFNYLQTFIFSFKITRPYRT